MRGIRFQIPSDWKKILKGELRQPYFQKLKEFLVNERAAHKVFPPERDIFNAFTLTPYEKVKVLFLGQDPYAGEGQAHGLSFSVRPGVRRPPSLLNIFKELHSDLGCEVPNNGYLVPWAEQGVMLLNTVLTVREKQPGSHWHKGWEIFTDAVIRALNERPRPLVFLLLGAHAQRKINLIDTKRHRIVKAPHPSPLARGFLGSGCFSAVNKALEDLGETPIDWQLPDI